MKLRKLLILEVLMLPFTTVSILWMKYIRKRGAKAKLSNWLMEHLGVLPIINHYFEPFISKKHLSSRLDSLRNLPMIHLNMDKQKDLLHSFTFQDELKEIPLKASSILEYGYLNDSFDTLDGSLYYSIIRKFKPKQIVEIGCGNSTKIALKAITQNKLEGSNCEFTCIEPYENPYLAKLDINLIRKKVEDIDLDFFKKLEENSILFIDSTHVIRPQGDVLFEFLELLPALPKGVIIHIHDIFTPRNYPKKWILEDKRLWDEQYLLEAFLMYNNAFEVIATANHLSYEQPELLKEKFPMYDGKEGQGASLYLRKIQ